MNVMVSIVIAVHTWLAVENMKNKSNDDDEDGILLKMSFG